MDNTHKSYLQSLHLWIHDTEAALQRGFQLVISNDTMNGTRQLITAIANCIQNDYPFYANELYQIADVLFLQSPNPLIPIAINSTAYGELVLIEKHLSAEPINVQFWSYIHPRICDVARSLYVDGHFSSAAKNAMVEVEARLRELFRELKPNTKEPAKVGDIIGALLTEGGAYHFVDTSTTSGKDFRRGIQAMFEGALAAYRNPASHKNLNRSQQRTIEQIVLASQLMYVLDNRQPIP